MPLQRSVRALSIGGDHPAKAPWATAEKLFDILPRTRAAGAISYNLLILNY